MKRFLLSSYFLYLAVFLIVFSLTAVLLLDIRHPLYAFGIVCGVVVYILQIWRKKLLKKEAADQDSVKPN